MTTIKHDTPLADAFALAMSRCFAHVTRLDGEAVYGHDTSTCDPHGCAGSEVLLGTRDALGLDAETGLAGDEIDLDDPERESARSAAFRAWIASDEIREWEFRQDDYGEGGHWHRPSDVADALKAWLAEGDYERSRTLWIDGRARPVSPVSGDALDVDPICATLVLYAEAPPCARGREHAWESPWSVVGGLRENPGVFGHGGGVKITEVCRHCGAYKTTDTWATRPDTGVQGLRSIEYQDADEDSLAWVHESREASS